MLLLAAAAAGHGRVWPRLLGLYVPGCRRPSSEFALGWPPLASAAAVSPSTSAPAAGRFRRLAVRGLWPRRGRLRPPAPSVLPAWRCGLRARGSCTGRRWWPRWPRGHRPAATCWGVVGASAGWGAVRWRCRRLMFLAGGLRLAPKSFERKLCSVLCWANNDGACRRRSPRWRRCYVVLGDIVLPPLRCGLHHFGVVCCGSSSLGWVLWGGAEAKAFACPQADDGDAFGRRFPSWRHHSFAPSSAVPTMACSPSSVPASL